MNSIESVTVAPARVFKALSSDDRLEFARRAAALRWTADNPVLQALTPEKLLTPVRYGDAATDLWTTFNVVQEHLARGGDRYLSRSEGAGLRRNRTRPVAGLVEGRTLNNGFNPDVGIKSVIPTCR